MGDIASITIGRLSERLGPQFNTLFRKESSIFTTSLLHLCTFTDGYLELLLNEATLPPRQSSFIHLALSAFQPFAIKTGRFSQNYFNDS